MVLTDEQYMLTMKYIPSEIASEDIQLHAAMVCARQNIVLITNETQRQRKRGEDTVAQIVRYTKPLLIYISSLSMFRIYLVL